MRFYRLLPLLLLAICFIPLSAEAGSKRKKNDLTVRFHLQASQQDGEPFIMAVPAGAQGLPAYVKKIPEINENDITAVYPFAAQDGTMGVALKLDPHGRIMLDTVSVENRGRVFVVLVNARVVTAMLIDRRVNDGTITIPSGLSQPEIDQFLKKYRVIGEPEGKKKRR